MRPLSHVVPGALVQLLRTLPQSPGKVEFAWRAAVGPALERVTAVCLEGDVLLVDASSRQWAAEVRRSSAIILRRLQSFLGEGVVSSIVVRSEPKA